MIQKLKDCKDKFNNRLKTLFVSDKKTSVKNSPKSIDITDNTGYENEDIIFEKKEKNINIYKKSNTSRAKAIDKKLEKEKNEKFKAKLKKQKEKEEKFIKMRKERKKNQKQKKKSGNKNSK